MPGSDGTNMLTEMTASALSRMTVARCGAVRAAGGMRTPDENEAQKSPRPCSGAHGIEAGITTGPGALFSVLPLPASRGFAPQGSMPRYGRLPAASTAIPQGAELEPAPPQSHQPSPRGAHRRLHPHLRTLPQ